MKTHSNNSSRRHFLKLGLSAGILSIAPFSLTAAPQLNTKAHVLILGVGAAGTAMANRLRRRLSGNKITIVGARKQHIYQPGFTTIASGLWPADRVISNTEEWLPQGVDWIDKDVESISGTEKTVTLINGDTLNYDILIVATGCQLNYDQIEGFDATAIGSNGIGSVYASAELALKTSQQIDQWLATGKGRGIFTLSSRRHLLPSVVPLRTQRATFTALGSSLHKGT